MCYKNRTFSLANNSPYAAIVMGQFDVETVLSRQVAKKLASAALADWPTTAGIAS
jgi:hypothetical protein